MTPLEQTLTALVHQQNAKIAKLQADLVDRRVDGLESRIGVIERQLRSTDGSTLTIGRDLAPFSPIIGREPSPFSEWPNSQALDEQDLDEQDYYDLALHRVSNGVFEGDIFGGKS